MTPVRDSKLLEAGPDPRLGSGYFPPNPPKIPTISSAFQVLPIPQGGGEGQWRVVLLLAQRKRRRVTSPATLGVQVVAVGVKRFRRGRGGGVWTAVVVLTSVPVSSLWRRLAGSGGLLGVVFQSGSCVWGGLSAAVGSRGDVLSVGWGRVRLVESVAGGGVLGWEVLVERCRRWLWWCGGGVEVGGLC